MQEKLAGTKFASAAMFEELRHQQGIVYEDAIIPGVAVRKMNDTWNGYKADDTVHTMSVTKSIVSLLVGIAIEQGLIGGVNNYVLDYFPDYKIKRGEKTVQKVTLKNLLTMTAPHKYKYEPWKKICVQEDWSIATLDYLGGIRGITGKFQYSTLGIHILAGIIATVSKMTTVDFANRYLFEPLMIAPRKIYVAPSAEAHKAFTIEKTPKGNIWFSDRMGVGDAGYGLCLSADEMSKIGLPCLNKGVYNNKRIVLKKWLEESTIVRLHCDKKFHDKKYGYLWWIIDENEGSYAAISNSGNVIYINPKRELVASASGYFKPTVFDRIDFIKEQIEKKLKNNTDNLPNDGKRKKAVVQQ